MRAALVQRAAQATWEMADNLEDWHRLSSPLEGRVHSMYADVKGLITTGVGNLIDSPYQASLLPWKHSGTGNLATKAEVTAAWNDLKANRDTLSKLHWKYAAKRNDLRLTDEDIDHLVETKLAEFEAYMTKHHFPGFVDFPADAQLALCSIAWACGPAFARKFVNLARFVNQHEWLLAKACAKISEAGNPGVVPRNQINYFLFENAYTVERHGLDLEELYWPERASLQPVPAPELPSDFKPEGDLIPLELPEDWHTSLEALRTGYNLDMYDRWS